MQGRVESTGLVENSGTGGPKTRTGEKSGVGYKKFSREEMNQKQKQEKNLRFGVKLSREAIND